jgi:deoxyribodipyrimidine photo-lyase
MIQSERVQPLNRHPVKKGKYVLYWMQASQRAEYNHALEFAIRQANLMKEPLVVFFGLTDSYPEANERHYHFMIDGLRTVQEALCARGIGLVIERVSPEIGAAKMAREASLVVCDRGYLRVQKKWRNHVAEDIDCLLLQVESDVVVPVDTVTGHLKPATCGRLKSGQW